MELKKSLVTAATKLALRAERWMRSKHPAHPAQAGRVLVLQFPTTLGCMVLETPIFEALRRCRPQRKIAVATYGLGLQVLRHSPFVDELIETQHPAEDLIGAARTLRRELRERNFRPDCILSAAFSRQRAITRLAVLAGPAWRGGFAEEPWMYDTSLAFDREISVLENNLRVPPLLGCDGSDLEPRIFYSQQEVDAAQTVFAAARRRGKPIMIAVAVGRSGSTWRPDRFAQVIRHAAATLGYEVFFTGTAGEAGAIEALRQLASCGASLAGMDSIPGQAALFAASDLMLSIDTGPMHMARASGTPMVALASCWERPHVWLPIGRPQVQVVQGPYNPTPGGDYRMDDLSAAQVKAALDEWAKRFPPDEGARSARVAASLSAIDHSRA